MFVKRLKHLLEWVLWLALIAFALNQSANVSGISITLLMFSIAFAVKWLVSLHDYRTNKERIKQKYKINIPSTNASEDGITGRRASWWEAASPIEVIFRELQKYPMTLIVKCELKRIILRYRLRNDNTPVGGVCQYLRSTIYINLYPVVWHLLSETAATQVRRTFHHEFYHLIDFRENGKIDTADSAWSSFNSPGFHYGRGGKSMISHGRQIGSKCAHLGFMTVYSMSGVEEDKAEIFSLLMADYHTLERRAARDPVVAAKVIQMKQRMAEFCPEMNDDYWFKHKGNSFN